MSFRLARVIAAVMLFVAVGDLPYDYYTILRWVVCGVAAFGAFLANEQRSRRWLWVFGIMAAFFNPLVPVHLTRAAWAPIDVTAAIVMLISLRAFTGSARSNGSTPRT